MNPKRTLTIFYKDAKSAILDGRVLVAILVPIALALFYNFSFDEERQTPDATIAHTGTTSALPQTLEGVTGDAANLTFETASPEQVRQMVAEEEADIGLIAPEGFDAAVQNGQSPQLTVLQPESPGFGGEVVAGSVEPALRALAGQNVPASVATESVAAGGSGNVLAQVEISGYFVLVAVVLLVGMICMLALPVILAEESEKKTLDALVMVASYGEVVVAKALVGLLYVVLSVALTLAITGVTPENLLLFGGAVLLLTITLTGFGLLMGSLFNNANQINTWSGFLLIPVLAPAFMVGFPMPEAVERALDFIPTSQATRLAVNGLSGEEIFSNPAFSLAVVVVWGVAAYLILLWALRRRQA